MSQSQDVRMAALPTVLGTRPKANQAKQLDPESGTIDGCSPGVATDATVGGDVEKIPTMEKYQRSCALLLGVAVLMLMQIMTHLFTRKLYTRTDTKTPLYHEVLFYTGLSISVSVLFAGCAARRCCKRGEQAWKRSIGVLAAWTSFCCAVSFGTMVRCFPEICSFYNSTGVLENETISFTHIDCPRLLGDVPARVVATFMGHIYAGAAIGVLGGLVVMKPRLSPLVPRVAIDAVDLQDFALLLLDDEILKTFWGKAEGGYGGVWLWWLIFTVCCLAVLSMMGELVYHYATISDAGAPSEASSQKKEWSSVDKITNACSLLCVEIPFLALRTYTSLRFDVPPSSLVLKNLCSICKEFWELYQQKHLSLGFYGSVVGAEDQ